MGVLESIIKRFPHEGEWLEFGKQYANSERKTCPRCGSREFHLHGQITIPPLFVQAMDEAMGVNRLYESERYFCASCEGFWDVVTRDEISHDK